MHLTLKLNLSSWLLFASIFKAILIATAAQETQFFSLSLWLDPRDRPNPRWGAFHGKQVIPSRGKLMATKDSSIKPLVQLGDGTRVDWSSAVPFCLSTPPTVPEDFTLQYLSLAARGWNNVLIPQRVVQDNTAEELSYEATNSSPDDVSWSIEMTSRPHSTVYFTYHNNLRLKDSHAYHLYACPDGNDDNVYLKLAYNTKECPSCPLSSIDACFRVRLIISRINTVENLPFVWL